MVTSGAFTVSRTAATENQSKIKMHSVNVLYNEREDTSMTRVKLTGLLTLSDAQ